MHAVLPGHGRGSSSGSDPARRPCHCGATAAPDPFLRHPHGGVAKDRMATARSAAWLSAALPDAASLLRLGPDPLGRELPEGSHSGSNKIERRLVVPADPRGLLLDLRHGRGRAPHRLEPRSFRHARSPVRGPGAGRWRRSHLPHPTLSSRFERFGLALAEALADPDRRCGVDAAARSCSRALWSVERRKGALSLLVMSGEP
jgi:hypothetical protein